MRRFRWFYVRRVLAQPLTPAKAVLEGPVVRNATSLYGTTIITSLFGFLYWFVAARMAPARAVGIASAIQSAAQFLSIFCVLGLSTLLISELSNDRRQTRSLILTAATVVAAFALILSTAVGLVLGVFSRALNPGLTGPIEVLVFVLLSVATTVLLVLDDSCIGLLRGDLQLRRNGVFAVSKLLLLPVLITIWPDRSGTELEVAWLAGLLVSMVTLIRRLSKITRGEPARLDLRRIFEKRWLMLGHHSLNISFTSPGLLIPVLVTVIIGPASNAAYTIAMLVASFVNIIPFHLSTALFALAPGDEKALAREVRKTMRICLILAIVSAPFFALLSGFILGIFGHSYEKAAGALVALGLTTYPVAIKAHYVAISRVRGRMQRAALWTAIGACLEVGLAAAGGFVHGVTGVAVGLLSGLTIEAAIFSPVVFGVLRMSRKLDAGAENGPPNLGTPPK
jgi:O-antigen/teichoic acid export membrane protein